MKRLTQPIIHITNYQQYINADFLQQRITDLMPDNATLPENIHISIAYMQVRKHSIGYSTLLALSMLGKSYKFVLPHTNENFYLAARGLELNSYDATADKDQHIRLFQQAFEAVVASRIIQIVNNIIKVYAAK